MILLSKLSFSKVAQTSSNRVSSVALVFRRLRRTEVSISRSRLLELKYWMPMVHKNSGSRMLSSTCSQFLKNSFRNC